MTKICKTLFFLVCSLLFVASGETQEKAEKQANGWLNIEIEYDVPPPDTLSPCIISLTEKGSKSTAYFEKGKGVPPGCYSLSAQRSGYYPEMARDIELKPNENRLLKITLRARSRPLCLEIVNNATQVLVAPLEISLKQNGKEYPFLADNDTFSPGDYDLIAKFKKYKTVFQPLKILPGEGAFVAKLPLQPLKNYEFSLRANTVTIDDIVYEYEFGVDGKKIEDHLVEIEKGIKRIYYSIWLDPHAEKLDVYAGFLFTRRNLCIGGSIGNLNSIDIARFIKHLELLKTVEKGHQASFEVMEKAVKRSNFRAMLKECASIELNQLMNHIRGWKDISDEARMKALLDDLERLNSKDAAIESNGRPYTIAEYKKSLPSRQVMYQIYGDYEGDKPLTPDEITLNGKSISYGESVKPDTYSIQIRKKGYDAISETVIIEPGNAPYILNEIMHSTPRRIQHYYLYLVPGMALDHLFPDVCTLNGKDVMGEESLRPGEYILNMQRRGFQPIEKWIRIPPDDVPYIIRENMYPKPRLLQMQITQDVPHDDASMAPRVSMTNENPRAFQELKQGEYPELKQGEYKELKQGDPITPASGYLFKIEMDGYDSDVFKDIIWPSEEPYKIVRRIVASPRAVVTRIIGEGTYPDESFVPDKITLDDKPIGKDFKIKPGTHDLVMLKDGYVPVRKQIRIGANARPYLLQEEMKTRSRPVTVKFLDSSSLQILSPDESTLGDHRVGSEITLDLKPGIYLLHARLKGYEGIQENILVPVGEATFRIERFMKAIRRDIIAEIRGDFKPDEDLIPDVFTLNDMPVSKKAQVMPGIFRLVIQKQGYFPVVEKIAIPPDPSPYSLKYRLISKPRQIDVSIQRSFGTIGSFGRNMDVDSIILGTENIQDGQKIKPGHYGLLIKKKGYKHLVDEILIQPSERPYLLERTLEPLPVLVKYEIAGDFDNKMLVPDMIALDDKTVDRNTAFTPGKYRLKIWKTGFSMLEKEVSIEPNEEPYVIKETMVSTPREIDLMITGDFPYGERCDPEVLTLDGKDARNASFKPGKYRMDIAGPSYTALKEDIVIPPAEEPYFIERILITKHRELKEKITYDVKPPDASQPCKIILAPVDKPKAEKIVKQGDRIKPDSYIMRIEKEGYETLEMKKHVWPSEEPIVFEHTLVAKRILLRIDILYDIEPPADLDPCRVSLVDLISSIPRYVQDGKRIKPGFYLLDIRRFGYAFVPRQKIEILPGEEPYTIGKKLIAKPRPILCKSYDPQTGLPVFPMSLTIDGKTINCDDEVKPGTHKMVVQFQDYKTVEKDVNILPGEGPFIETVVLQPLPK